MSSEKITIKGRLGPLGTDKGRVTLDIRPFTLLIGVQGVGKSLLSQFLYFFRDAHYLLSSYEGIANAEKVENLVAWVVEGLRAGTSTSRSLASMVVPSTDLKTAANFKYEFKNIERKLSVYRNRSPRIQPLSGFKEEILFWLQPTTEKQTARRAIFIPDERSYYSRFLNTTPTRLGDSAVSPIPMLEFARILEIATNVSFKWQKGETPKPSEVKHIEKWTQKALRGQASVAERGPYAKRWVWQPVGSDNVLDIEMASSGQKEAWPLVVTLKALFAKDGLPFEAPVSLYIEEPESHLHPAAQVAMLKILVYLVQQGYRVVVTTHSLTVLYALNNLMLGFRRNPQVLSEPELALDPEMVSAYHMRTDGQAENLLDRKTGFIDEVALGYMNDRLATKFYQFAYQEGTDG